MVRRPVMFTFSERPDPWSGNCRPQGAGGCFLRGHRQILTGSETTLLLASECNKNSRMDLVGEVKRWGGMCKCTIWFSPLWSLHGGQAQGRPSTVGIILHYSGSPQQQLENGGLLPVSPIDLLLNKPMGSSNASEKAMAAYFFAAWVVMDGWCGAERADVDMYRPLTCPPSSPPAPPACIAQR